MKTFEKILHTIMSVFVASFGLYLTFRFCYGYKTMDDDIMFISGLCLAVLVSIIILIRIIVFDIYVIWHKEKKKVKKEKKDEKEKV